MSPPARPKWKFFAPVLQEDIDDLNPYQIKLLAYYRAHCAGKRSRTCEESVRETAAAVHMGFGKVSELRKELAALGRIVLIDVKNEQHVQCVDRMALNIARYDNRSHYEQFEGEIGADGENVRIANDGAPEGETVPNTNDTVPITNTFAETVPITNDTVPITNSLSGEDSKSLESITEEAANIRAQAREAAAAFQTPYQPDLKLIKSIKPPGGDTPESLGEPERADDANIFALYRTHIGEPDAAMYAVLVDALALYPAEDIAFAFRELADQGDVAEGKRWVYVRKILERLREDGEEQARQKADVAAAMTQIGAAWTMPAREPDCFGEDDGSRDAWDRMENQIAAEFDAGAQEYWRGARAVSWDGTTLVVELRGQHCTEFFKGWYGRSLARVVRLFWGKEAQIALRARAVAVAAAAEG